MNFGDVTILPSPSRSRRDLREPWHSPSPKAACRRNLKSESESAVSRHPGSDPPRANPSNAQPEPGVGCADAFQLGLEVRT
jgi:hypothetical protein